MSRLYFLLIVLLVFISCKHSVIHNSNVTHQNDTDTIYPFKKIIFKATYNDALLSKYSSYLTTLDINKWESPTSAAQKYTNLFLDADLNTRDSALFIFNKFYERLDANLDDLHNKDTTIKYDSLIVDSANHISNLSPRLALYYQKLKANGFKIFMSEGDTYVGQDQDFIAKWFYSYVSFPVKEYLIQLNKEDKEGFAEDAGLTISPKMLVDRTVWWERFAEKYPNIIVTNKAQVFWQDNITTLLEGMDNSPVIEIGNTNLKAYYKTAYEYLKTNYPHTRTNAIINPYFNLMLNKQKSKADKLLKEYQQKGIITVFE